MMTRPAEDDLIARLFAPIAGSPGLGLLDDAALLTPTPGCQLVMTKDALVEGVHFFAEDEPASIARKALGVNLSDLAAKASRPVGFLLAVALAPAWTADWLQAFAAGLGEAADRYRCPLIGGDTVATPGPGTLSITALGEVEAGTMLPRTGARSGDILYVSGTIGDAALGLQLRLADGRPAPWMTALTEGERAHLLDRYLHPEPRLDLASALRVADAGMDVSDGLVGDLAKMLRASGVSGRLDLARIPVSAAARSAIGRDAGCLEIAVTGGDDYEILAAVPPGHTPVFEREAAAAGVPVAAIGIVSAGQAPLQVIGTDGTPRHFARGSYTHR